MSFWDDKESRMRHATFLMILRNRITSCTRDFADSRWERRAGLLCNLRDQPEALQPEYSPVVRGDS
jgi:hypothetical protein